jgi:NAD(P)-dependent dehydrogenase (short-subunit alcohol dehydrogenase family)
MDTQTVVIVTGAARGLGRAIAEVFGKADATVALVDLLVDEVHQTAQEMSDDGIQCSAFVADTTDAIQVKRMVGEVEDELGPVDVLVNNAGTFSYIGPVWEADPDTWFRDVRTNLYGSFLCTRYVVERMVDRGSGYVINIVSGGGVGDPHPHSTSYATSKTGLMRLTEGLAVEAKDHGVKVFAVGPPAIKTAMTDFIANDKSGKKWRPTFSSIFAEGRDARVDDIASFVASLTSGSVDRLTGRFLDPRHDLQYYEDEMETIIANDAWTLRIAGRVRAGN